MAAVNYNEEVGRGGVRKAGHYVSADFLPKLQGRNGARAYHEMSKNDALVHGIVFALKMLARQVKWRVEPREKTAEAVKAAEWLQRALFEEMDTPWPEVMAAAASKFVYGYAPCELVLKKLDDGTIGVKKIALRAQDTVDEWDFEDDSNELRGLWQSTYEAERVYLPIQKVLLFRTTSERDNPEGESLLRGAYIYFSQKKAIEEAEGRSALRSAGVVHFEVPSKYLQKDASASDKALLATFEQWARLIAEDRAGYLFTPSDVDETTKQPLFKVSFLVADGRRGGDFSPLLERRDLRMASSVLAQFILLGQQGVGSLALSEDQSDLFEVALSGFADMDRAEIESKVVRLLWRLNGFNDKVRPKLAFEDIDMPSLAELGQFITQIVGAGYPMYHELNQYLAKRAGIPEPPKVAMPKPGEKPGEKPNEDADKEEAEIDKDFVRFVRKRNPDYARDQYPDEL